MMKSQIKNLAGCLILLSLLPACSPKKSAAPADLPIYFTCDTRGRLEPCGCFVGQFGGLTRLKTVLDAEAGANALRVDVGDAVGGVADFDVIQYRYLQRAFAAMKFDALNAGQAEARLSAAQLRELGKNSAVPMISANLLDRANGKPVFDAYRIVERDGRRIAILGVVDPRGFEGELGEGLQVETMESALARCLAEVKAKADAVVLLAFTDEATLAQLARQFYELDVILGGKVSQPAQELKRENRSLIYFVTNESRALGILRLRLGAVGAPEVLGHEVRLLHDAVPQDESLRELARAYRGEVRRARLAVDDPKGLSADRIPGARTAAAYVGTAKCVECHQQAAAVWKKSGHAHAFATLIDRQADADPKCIACHTIGFGAESGYRREFAATQLIDVGCESCHGAGSLHVRAREGDATVNFTFRPLDAGDCQKCHYGEFSRPFIWNEFWPPIRHGKEKQQASAPSP